MEILLAASFILGDKTCLKIYPAGKNCDSRKTHNVRASENLILHYGTVECGRQKAELEYSDSELSIPALRLRETVRYCCRVESSSTGDDGAETAALHIHNETNHFVKIERDQDYINFQFINYLGKSYIYDGAEDCPSKRAYFEIVPDKIDYEEDYIALTEAIADECAALLLEYSSPSMLDFDHDSERQKDSVLEQFIFLRKFCYPDNLLSLIEAIKRNPDRILVEDDEWHPTGDGIPSRKFMTEPFANSRGWSDAGDGFCLPSMLAVQHKYDSYDTPANRFVKFALREFLEICSDLIRMAPAAELCIEAERVRSSIEDVLGESFFIDVGDMEIMPVNNQVLEKREGYSQIFSAFSMVDMAVKLDWNGKNDAYEGESKNTALLYEYWLFFILNRILSSIPDCRSLNGNEIGFRPFILEKDGLTVSLKQGIVSMRGFILNSRGLRINLYYNRTFPSTDFSTSLYWGSYSRPFRPDYTVALFSSDYETEKDAMLEGGVSYIHFDAKYRLTDLSGFIDNYDKNKISGNTIESIETEIPEKITEEISEEDGESVVNTYRRGDLLKMHTYNDAIRRTIGSYVLYPGTAEEGRGNESIRCYDEILPGVGAFAVRPGDKDSGIRAVRKFILDVIDFKSRNCSRLYRRDYFDGMILKSPAENFGVRPESEQSGNFCMVGFMRGNYYRHIASMHLVPDSADDQGFSASRGIYFYYHAIRDGYVYPLHKDISKAKLFCASLNDFGIDGKNECQPWIADIVCSELVSVGVLAERLYRDCGFDNTESGGAYKAQYYYLVRLENVRSLKSDMKMVKLDSGNDAISPYSPKIYRIG